MSDRGEGPKAGIAEAISGDKEAQKELMKPENDVEGLSVSDEDSEKDLLSPDDN